MHRSKSTRTALNSLDTSIFLAATGLCVTWSINSTDYGHAQPWVVGLLIVGVINTFCIVRSYQCVHILTPLYVVAVGFADRIVRSTFPGSDVIDATREAVQATFSGHNPYFHFFMTTRPAGSPFPYFPGEVLFYGIPYALFHSIDTVDKFSGIAILLLIIALAPIVGTARASLGTAVYAVFSLAALRSVDGSNDTSLAFLMLLSIVLLAWSEHTGKQSLFYMSAFFFAWALLFKALSWPFAPFLIAYLFKRGTASAQRYLIITSGTFLFFLTPFLFPSPSGIITNFHQGLTFHNSIWGLNIWNALLSAGVQLNPQNWMIPFTEIGLTGLFFLMLLKRQGHSLGEALLCGVGTLTTLLLLAPWSTSPYFTYAGIMFITAITCHIPQSSTYGLLAGSNDEIPHCDGDSM
jgi:hypothetical protein